MQTCAFGERLRVERERLGLKQEELGQFGGVNRNTQGKYEKGDRSPDASYLAAVYERGVDVLYVVTGARMLIPADSISIEESKLLENYRSLPDSDRAAMERMAAAMAALVQRTK
ncbi:helix-turn-helix transcriptional regulator [Pseudomonas sp.]|uniref:helix-turn-helix domain-containing protein n=1 Tax=Pseudomonas sp. TaxID=306 RepID=UPI00257EF087|nr:helix-turn-helix transcriptional regulator [Pseudomonas sp.]